MFFQSLFDFHTLILNYIIHLWLFVNILSIFYFFCSLVCLLCLWTLGTLTHFDRGICLLYKIIFSRTWFIYLFIRFGRRFFQLVIWNCISSFDYFYLSKYIIFLTTIFWQSLSMFSAFTFLRNKKRIRFSLFFLLITR